MAMLSVSQEMGVLTRKVLRILLRCSCSMSYSSEVDCKSRKYEQPVSTQAGNTHSMETGTRTSRPKSKRERKPNSNVTAHSGRDGCNMSASRERKAIIVN